MGLVNVRVPMIGGGSQSRNPEVVIVTMVLDGLVQI
jgi:hypothetical protein